MLIILKTIDRLVQSAARSRFVAILALQCADRFSWLCYHVILFRTCFVPITVSDITIIITITITPTVILVIKLL
jgi:hypothetical protein